MSTSTKIYIFFGLAAAGLGAWYVFGSAIFGATPPQEPPDTRTIGEVTAVSEGTVTVRELHYQGRVVPTAGQHKTFKVDTATKIWMQVPRDFAAFEAEYAAFKKEHLSTTSTTAPPPTPLPYTEQLLELQELKVGSTVTLTPGLERPTYAQEILVTVPPPE